MASVVLTRTRLVQGRDELCGVGTSVSAVTAQRLVSVPTFPSFARTRRDSPGRPPPSADAPTRRHDARVSLSRLARDTRAREGRRTRAIHGQLSNRRCAVLRWQCHSDGAPATAAGGPTRDDGVQEAQAVEGRRRRREEDYDSDVVVRQRRRSEARARRRLEEGISEAFADADAASGRVRSRCSPPR